MSINRINTKSTRLTCIFSAVRYVLVGSDENAPHRLHHFQEGDALGGIRTRNTELSGDLLYPLSYEGYLLRKPGSGNFPAF